MQEPRLVYRCDGATQVDPDERRFLCPEYTPNRQDLPERQTFDEVHPEPHRLVMLIHSVYGDNVRMPHSGQQPRLPNHGRRLVRTSQNLQRNFSLETGIPRDVHGAETPVADGPADLQRPPCESCEGRSIRV
jgi:hypothetical protein